MTQAFGFNPIMGVTEQLARAVPDAPRPDEAALRRAYAQSPLATEPDTFCLVRVVGNDLPPRHQVGQARQNVRFTLENEAAFPHCTKHWIINRIVVPEEEAALIELIASFGVSYEVVPFEADAYARVPWDFAAFDQPVLTDPDVLAQLGADRGDTALDQFYRHKNCYVMNNNGARNVALRAGQARAKWALPWDGNCFVTPAGWQAIAASVTAKPHLPYFIVPMARVLDNDALLRDDFVPNAVEEPQVIFRRDAPDRFDERYRYGRRPKVEFLWRIGVPGPWDTYRNNAWDAPFPSLSPRAGQFDGAGWVARLFSGQGHLEAAEKTSAKSRAVARQTAISSFIDTLDSRMLARRGDGPDFLALDPMRLDAQATRREAAPQQAVLAVAEAAANGAGAESLPARLFVHALAARLHARSDLAARARAELERALMRDEAAALLVPGTLWYLADAVRLIETQAGLDPASRRRLTEHLEAWLERAPARGFDVGYELDRLAASHLTGHWYEVARSLRRLNERLFHHAFRPAGSDAHAATAADLQRWVNAARAAERFGADFWNERNAAGTGLEEALQHLLATPWAADAPAARPLRAALREAYPCFDPPPGGTLADDARSDPASDASPDAATAIRPFWMLG